MKRNFYINQNCKDSRMSQDLTRIEQSMYHNRTLSADMVFQLNEYQFKKNKAFSLQKAKTTSLLYFNLTTKNFFYV